MGLMFAVVLLLQDPPAEQPEKKEFVRPTQKEIDRAIDSGAEYLIRSQGGDGSWAMGPGDLPDHAFKDHMGPQVLGHTALCLLTILHADVDPDHESIQRGFKFLVDNMDRFAHTYNCALTLMAVDVLAEKKMKKSKAKPGRDALGNKGKDYYFNKLGPIKDLAKQLAVRLVKGQLKDGSWTYGAFRGVIRSGTGVQGSGGGGKAPRAGRPPVPLLWRDLGGDLSNTQYALLGLRAAAEVGIRFDKNVFFEAIECFLRRQRKKGPKVSRFPVPAATDRLWKGNKVRRSIRGRTHTQEGRPDFRARGWGYTRKRSRPAPYGAMTTIGVASLVICKYYLKDHKGMDEELTKQVNEGIEDGCAWILENFSVKDNVKWTGENVWKYKNDPPKIDGYYMYGIERAAVLAGVQFFGKQEWYPLGARLLIDQQQKEGSWSSDMAYEPRPTVSTCFAVLFLKRATRPMMIETHGAEKKK